MEQCIFRGERPICCIKNAKRATGAQYMVRSGGFRLVIDKWLRLGRRNSLFRRISSVQPQDSAVDELAVLHILQRDIRGAFRLLGRSGGAELRARHADLFERRGDGLLRLAEGIV